MLIEEEVNHLEPLNNLLIFKLGINTKILIPTQSKASLPMSAER